MNGNFDYDKMMSAYKARLKKGAFLKALMIGLLSGFGAMLLYALVDWMVGLKLFYIGIAVMVGVAAAVTAILYFVAFYPTDVKVARALDQLGLYERVVTMREFRNDNSFMAQRQREDTVATLKTVDAKVVLSIVVSLAMIISVTLTGIASAGALTYSAFAETSGLQLIKELTADRNEYYSVITYEVNEKTRAGGYIEGETKQELANGSDTTAVTAIANDGWEFVSWSDGLETPTRFEKNVKEDATYVATFQKSDGSMYEEGDPDEDPGYDGDPGMLGEGKGQPGDGQEGILPPRPGQKQEGENPGKDGGEEGSGSPSREDYTSKIIDGETYYGDEMDQAISEATENANNGEGGYESELNDLINEYLGGLGGN